VSDPVSRTRWQQWEPLTIVLLVEAGAFLFAVGWLTGVLMLWTSRQWRIRDKIVGTLLVPGGFAPAAVFTFWTKQCTTIIGLGGIAEERCGHISTTPWIDMLTLVVLWVAPLVSMAWLVRHHQAQPPVQLQPQHI
jgi:ABC-type Mn2+/Zn2+ transport system permease subunit